MSSVLTRVSKDDCLAYLRLVQEIQPTLDLTDLYRVAQAAVRYYRGDTKQRSVLVAQQRLETQWYASLQRGQPDYSVYNHDYFISDLWACWIIYSRKHLLSLLSSKALPNDSRMLRDIFSSYITSVADLGCGFGYTTATLKEMFPLANVYGTNLIDTLQWRVATLLGQREDFDIVQDVIDRRIDCVFASEFFEHLLDPVAYLETLITHCAPSIFILANSFSARSIGHFNEYQYREKRIANTAIGRLFNRVLRENGYRMLKTRLWNNRPSIWLRSDIAL